MLSIDVYQVRVLAKVLATALISGTNMVRVGEVEDRYSYRYVTVCEDSITTVTSYRSRVGEDNFFDQYV